MTLSKTYRGVTTSHKIKSIKHYHNHVVVTKENGNEVVMSKTEFESYEYRNETD